VASVDTPEKSNLTSLTGVGPALLKNLQHLGIQQIEDLWFHLPLRYEDRTRITPIDRVIPGSTCQVEGVVQSLERGFKFRPQLRVFIADETGALLTLRYFHFSRAQADLLCAGTRLRAYGEIRHSAQGLEMIHPSYQRIIAQAPLESSLTPVYPASEGLQQRRLRSLIAQSLMQLPQDEQLECLPKKVRAKLKLSSLREALRYVHRPPPNANVSLLLAGQHPAQQRLAFEELLAHHLSLKKIRLALRTKPAPRIDQISHRRSALLAQLSFSLTNAQRRVLQDIDQDMANGVPMLRLLQGDVGSGKTIVAALAALAIVDSGWQVAVLAPTEVLAEQHYANFSRWLQPLGIHLVWLTGAIKGKVRERALADIADSAHVVVGTHALMQDDVHFRRLGLVVIDEQHRFGVHQRLALRDKACTDGITAHQLVMTATPIPRTLAMTAYADLDSSVIDELPPGRTPIKTVVLAQTRREEIMARVQQVCLSGRQVYWVCTLIEESEKLEAQAAQASYADLCAALPDIRIGLVHGRLKAKEKQSIMEAFKQGQLALLVATTVIEVGVDVPNASLMIIENAERLGLSQLHQLRGRVGRGNQASSCVLLYQTPLSAMARERLQVMRETNDGFRIADKDLQLRGPGELLGTKQTGDVTFRVAKLSRDTSMIPSVHETANILLEQETDAVNRLIRRWIGSALRYAEA
jgi:ATP-dependent DNA helicase RecG